MLEAGIAAVKRRGKSDQGEKTMLDVPLSRWPRRCGGRPSVSDNAGDVGTRVGRCRRPCAAPHQLHQGDQGPGLVPRRAQCRPYRSRAPAPAPCWSGRWCACSRRVLPRRNWARPPPTCDIRAAGREQPLRSDMKKEIGMADAGAPDAAQMDVSGKARLTERVAETRNLLLKVWRLAAPYWWCERRRHRPHGPGLPPAHPGALDRPRPAGGRHRHGGQPRLYVQALQ